MSILETVITIIGALMLGAGLGLAVVVAMARREMKRRAARARADRMPTVEHWPM